LKYLGIFKVVHVQFRSVFRVFSSVIQRRGGRHVQTPICKCFWLPSVFGWCPLLILA